MQAAVSSGLCSVGVCSVVPSAVCILKLFNHIATKYALWKDVSAAELLPLVYLIGLLLCSFLEESLCRAPGVVPRPVIIAQGLLAPPG